MQKDPVLYNYETEAQESASIAVYTGGLFDVFNPDPDKIKIEDIAHALSLNCRWGGHCRHFYSVAQHSLMCAYLAPAPIKLEALMHDASEAYLLDVPRPIKQKLANYKQIEDKLMRVIADKYGFRWPLSKEVKEIDEKMLEYEWNGLIKKEHELIKEVSTRVVEQEFITYFNHLIKSR